MRNRLLPFVFLALSLLALACRSAEKRRDELQSAVERYNEMIRWERAERALPYVHETTVTTWRDWSETYAGDVDLQEWRIRQIRWPSPTTAVVEIERKGFEVKKLIEKTWRIDQTWVDVGAGTWKLREGF